MKEKKNILAFFENVKKHKKWLGMTMLVGVVVIQPEHKVVARPASHAPTRVFEIVKGTVKDANGEGLPGASIAIKGKSGGTATDINGDFSINAEIGDILVISFVGFKSQEITVTRAPINVTLSEDGALLEEVVVIGYGTAKKRDLTGSAVKIAGKDLSIAPNPNPLNSLQGKASGLQVTASATPGGEPDVRIRGSVSTGSTRPLYLVDGIFADDISYINPSDISSVEVLKDPSSLAIFGVRGANGVIVITTKKAAEGKMQVNFNTTYGFKKLGKKINMVNAAEFKELYEEEKVSLGDETVFDYSPWTGNTDWIDEVTRIGKYSTTNLSVAKATEKNSFKLGIGYINDQGIIKKQVLEKYLLSFNDEIKLTKKITVGLNFNGSRYYDPWSDANVALEQARRAVPIANSYGPDGVTPGMLPPYQNAGIKNPLLSIINESPTQIILNNRLVGSIFADYKFLENLTFRATWYGDYLGINNRDYNGRYNAYYPVTRLVEPFEPGLTQVKETNSSYRNFQQDYILNYNRALKERHNFAATAGITSYLQTSSSISATVKQGTDASSLEIPNNKRFWYLNTGFADPNSLRLNLADTWQRERSTFSYLIRGLYNFDHRYYLSASFRRDGSSAFLKDNRWQNFYAIGLAWEVSNESFMKNNNKYLDYLKLKASYGQLGNQNTYGYNYPAYPSLSTSSAGVFGNSLFPAYAQDYLPNPNLHWETIISNEIGLEMVAFDNRLNFDAAYYYRKSKDLMTIIPGVNGALSTLINIGNIRSQGIELSASWNQKIAKDFNLTLGGNFTTLNNKVLALINNGFSIIDGINRVQEGFPLGYFYGYIAEGLYQSEAHIAASPDVVGLGTVRPGDVKFKDISGPEGIPDGQIDANDRTMIGNPTPDFIYGLTLSINHKNFDLSFDFNGVYGNEVYRFWNGTESEFQRVNYAQFQTNRWHGEGTSNFQPALGSDRRINYQHSTLAIEDGSYFRIRNIQLGYNFPTLLVHKWKMQNFRVFANMQNPVTWTNNHGYTPEFATKKTGIEDEKNESIKLGRDNGGGALPVVTTFGLNLTF